MFAAISGAALTTLKVRRLVALKMYGGKEKSKYPDEIVEAAVNMRGDNKSFRIIARELGIDHPQKVKHIVTRELKRRQKAANLFPIRSK